MNKLYFLFAAVMAASTISSAALLPEQSVRLQGIDVRDKDGKYVLVIDQENIVLEERHYKLLKIDGAKKHLVAEGSAVFMGADDKHDTEAVWKNENTELKFGRMVGSQKPKQVVVLKLKDLNRTFAFEMFHEL